jgi:GNAT superfamily N-acetyltransferase
MPIVFLPVPGEPVMPIRDGRACTFFNQAPYDKALDELSFMTGRNNFRTLGDCNMNTAIMKKWLEGKMIWRATHRDISTLVEQRHMMLEDILHRESKEHRIADAVYRKWIIEMSKQSRFVGFLGVQRVDTTVGGGCVWIRDVQPTPNIGTRLESPYLISVYTDSRYRSMGIATAIARTAMEWSKENGYATMTLTASDYGKTVYRKQEWKRTSDRRINLGKLHLKAD